MRDFTEISGINIMKDKTMLQKCALVGGEDYNGWGWKYDNESFKKEYGFEFGSDSSMTYLSLRGAIKVIRTLEDDHTVRLKPDAVKILRQGLETILKVADKEKIASKKTPFELNTIDNKDISVQININIDHTLSVC